MASDWVSATFVDTILRNDAVYIAGIKNNTRATVVVRPGVARAMRGSSYQLTRLKIVANNI